MFLISMNSIDHILSSKELCFRVKNMAGCHITNIKFLKNLFDKTIFLYMSCNLIINRQIVFN